MAKAKQEHKLVILEQNAAQLAKMVGSGPGIHHDLRDLLAEGWTIGFCVSTQELVVWTLLRDVEDADDPASV